MRSWWLGAVLLTVGVSAHAQEYLSPPPDVASPITDHLAFRAIYFLGKVSTHSQFDPSNGDNDGLGTNFTAEHELGLTNKADQFRVELMFRLEDRSRLRVNFLDLRREGDKQLSENLQFGNTTFTVGSVVQSEFDYREMDVTYTYSFLRAARYELGAGVGLQLLDAEANASVPATPKFSDFSGAGPFATPAIDGTVLLDRHWSLNARAQYLHVTFESVGGLWEDYHGDLQYRWRRNLAAGLGFEYQEIGVNLNHSNPAGVVHLRIAGPEAFLRASF
jgi:hypothetical protein